MQKRRDIRNFYVDEAFIPVWQSFMEICAREGESASLKIREFVERYVCVHAGGNPQQLIEKYFGYISPKECFFCRGHFPTLKKVEYIAVLWRLLARSALIRTKQRASSARSNE